MKKENKGRPCENCCSGTAPDPREIGSASVVSDNSDPPTQTQDDVGPGHDQEAVTDPLDCTESLNAANDLSQSETEALQAFKVAAEEAGYRVQDAPIFRYVGSGNSHDREGLRRLLALIQAQEIDTVWVYDLARLYRNPLDLLTLLKEFADNGVVLRVVGQPATPTRTRDCVMAIAGWQHALRQVAERSKRSKAFLAQRGQLPVGNPSFGYDYDPHSKVRVVNPAEAQVVRKIFDRVAAGKTPSRVAKGLNQRGVPTKHAGQWVGTTVKAVVNCTSYYGIDYYGRTRRTVTIVNGRRKIVPVEVPRDEWIAVEGFSPPIISRATFEAAQRALKARGSVEPK